MSLEKTVSECITLLSVYNYEDDELDELDDEREMSLLMVGDEGSLDKFLPTPPVAKCSEELQVNDEIEEQEREDMSPLIVGEQKDEDSLDKFLPPPPMDKCSEELQEKISKFILVKKSTGRSFNAEVRNRKEYRNPDFLQHVVTYQHIDQIGSCLRIDVFDPHGYDKSDFYDEIEADIRRELERREQEKKKKQKLEFTPGGIQAVNVVPTPKINIPTPGLATVAGGVSNATSTLSDVTSWDARQNKKLKWDTSWDARHNKKSKWDKMDADPRSSLPPEGKENISAVRSALDALISTAEAALVQQMRRQGGR